MDSSQRPNAGKNKFTLSVGTESDSDSSDLGDFQNGGFFWAENNQDHARLAMKALNEKNYDAFNFLVKNNVVQNFDVKDNYGKTILHKAVESGRSDLVKNIINNENVGSIINTQSKNGDTPLILAVKSGNNDIADLLIGRGADKNIKNSEGLWVGTDTHAEEVASHGNFDMSKDTESILDSILDSYMNKQQQLGGSRKKSSSSMLGSRTVKLPTSRGSSLSRAENVTNTDSDKLKIKQKIVKESDKIRERILQKIKEIMGVDDDTAVAYRSLLWYWAKENFKQEDGFRNYDRWVESEKNTNAEFLKKEFKKKDVEAKKKEIKEHREKREQERKSSEISISNSSSVSQPTAGIVNPYDIMSEVNYQNADMGDYSQTSDEDVSSDSSLAL